MEPGSLLTKQSAYTGEMRKGNSREQPPQMRMVIFLSHLPFPPVYLVDRISLQFFAQIKVPISYLPCSTLLPQCLLQLPVFAMVRTSK